MLIRLRGIGGRSGPLSPHQAPSSAPPATARWGVPPRDRRHLGTHRSRQRCAAARPPRQYHGGGPGRVMMLSMFSYHPDRREFRPRAKPA